MLDSRFNTKNVNTRQSEACQSVVATARSLVLVTRIGPLHRLRTSPSRKLNIFKNCIFYLSIIQCLLQPQIELRDVNAALKATKFCHNHCNCYWRSVRPSSGRRACLGPGNSVREILKVTHIHPKLFIR